MMTDYDWEVFDAEQGSWEWEAKLDEAEAEEMHSRWPCFPKQRNRKVSGGEQLCTGWTEMIREFTGKPWWQSGPRPYRKFIKKRKLRAERRKAKLDPEAPATYGRYQGYD